MPNLKIPSFDEFSGFSTHNVARITDLPKELVIDLMEHITQDAIFRAINRLHGYIPQEIIVTNLDISTHTQLCNALSDYWMEARELIPEIRLDTLESIESVSKEDMDLITSSENKVAEKIGIPEPHRPHPLTRFDLWFTIPLRHFWDQAETIEESGYVDATRHNLYSAVNSGIIVLRHHTVSVPDFENGMKAFWDFVNKRLDENSNFDGFKIPFES